MNKLKIPKSPSNKIKTPKDKKEPLIIKCNKSAFFDVDDTLLMWDNPDQYSAKVKIGERFFGLNTENIERLKNHHIIGHTVIVWSNGGWQHAQNVINKAGLSEYVHAIMNKPTWIYDDMPIEHALPNPKYVGELPDSLDTQHSQVPAPYSAQPDTPKAENENSLPDAETDKE